MHAMIFLAFTLGVMLSPDMLILVGNTLGYEGRAALSGLLVAGGLHALTARTYGRLGLHPAARGGESQILHATFGPLVATVLPLCARVIYTVSAATGILAIAGYVFNEVFVYWFPNLGFSFCLLGMVLGLTWRGRVWPRWRNSVTWHLPWAACSAWRPWGSWGLGRLRQGSRSCGRCPGDWRR